MSTDAISLFEKALTQDENQQLEFASRIDQIVSAFPPKIVSQEIYPFLAAWIPRNSQKIVSTLCSKVDKLASVTDAFVALAPVVESLLASENAANAKVLKEKLLTVKGTPGLNANGFLKRLASSPLDFVRSFIPRVISLLSSDEDQRAIFSTIAFDHAFKVRFSVCLAIPRLPEELAKQVAISLQADSNSRIKALLPVVCMKSSFWFTSLAEQLTNDHDWSVRASVAKELVNATDTESALKYCCQLIEDNVWQVIYCALTSLTAILKRQKNPVDSAQFSKILDTLLRIMPFPQVTLKNAVIDAFLAILQTTKLDESKVSQFVNDVITKQPPNTKLHFLNSVSNSGLSQIIVHMRDKLYAVVVSLLASDQWRTRLGIIQAVNNLAALNGEEELNKRFSDLCFQTLDDEATPVRDAAAEELAKFFIAQKTGKLYPDSFLTLKQANSFRKRQSALKLLLYIARQSPPDIKAKVIAEMKSFQNDPCENVVNLSKHYISLIQ